MSEHQQQESKERLARPLIQLAKLYNVMTAYTSDTGKLVEIPDDVIQAVLAGFGVDASNPQKARAAAKKAMYERRTRLIRGTVVAVEGKRSRVTVNHRLDEIPKASLTLENGEPYVGHIGNDSSADMAAYPVDDSYFVSSSLVIPEDVPMGYHRLHVETESASADATLIVAPSSVPLLPSLEDGQLWGWMAQFYSIRSHQSWGVGDFHDLAQLVRDAHNTTGADFMLINPVHAAEPVAPLTPSPYLPSSRRFVNFTYLRPEDIEEYRSLSEEERAQIRRMRQQVASLNDDPNYIDRDAMWKAKMPALWRIFSAPRSPERQRSFDDYKRRLGAQLDSYAAWCVAYDVWGQPQNSTDSWVKKYSVDSPEIRELLAQHADTFEFYKWLEWNAEQQLTAAQTAAKGSGMKIGLMVDMAVGVHPLGAAAWGNPKAYVSGMSVGAPPDYFNSLGQNWSQPPLNPSYMEETGYRDYIDLIRSQFQFAGAVRIDHIIGLFRLWYVPDGHTAAEGTYVGYDADALLGILAVEATRAHGVIVGEDLGVVPPQTASALRSHGLLGFVVEWFEKNGNTFKDPKTYREYAIASVVTHDMPPTAGYLDYAQVQIRKELGMPAAQLEEFKAGQMAEHEQLLHFLVDGGWLSREDASDDAHHEQQVVEAMHKALKQAPSKLLCAALVDGVGEKRIQNQPGTDNEYPNWRVPLADGEGNVVYAEDVFSLDRVRSLGRIMNA